MGGGDLVLTLGDELLEATLGLALHDRVVGLDVDDAACLDLRPIAVGRLVLPVSVRGAVVLASVHQIEQTRARLIALHAHERRCRHHAQPRAHERSFAALLQLLLLRISQLERQHVVVVVGVGVGVGISVGVAEESELLAGQRHVGVQIGQIESAQPRLMLRHRLQHSVHQAHLYLSWIS